MGLDAGQQFAAPPDIENPLAQQRPQRAFGGGIDIGWRNQVTAEQVGELFGVNAVVLVLAAVNGLEIEGMGQHEVQARRLAGIGQPIPAKHAFGANRQVVTIGATSLRKNSKSLFRMLVWTSFFPSRSMTQTYIWRAWRSIPQLNWWSKCSISWRVVFHG